MSRKRAAFPVHKHNIHTIGQIKIGSRGLPSHNELFIKKVLTQRYIVGYSSVVRVIRKIME